VEPDLSLLRVFIDEAMHYLSACEQSQATTDDRERALASLAQAGELIGDGDTADRIRSVIATLAQQPAAGADHLAELVRDLRSRMPVAQIPDTDLAPVVPLPLLGDDDDLFAAPSP
jgi:hypothetical protein